MNKPWIMTLLAALWAFLPGYGADTPEVINAKLDSRDRAIHLTDDWMRDPFITRGPDDVFYLSCTRLDHIAGGVQGIEVWTSPNLAEWRNAGVPWTTDDSSWLGPVLEEAGGRSDGRGYLLWAPEIWFVDGHWVCVHTANVGKANLLRNDSAELKGPFVEPMGAQLGRRHDPSLFTDDDGTHWLIYGCTEIVPLSSDFGGLAGPPVHIAPSNRKMGHEGCQLIKVGTRYVLFGTAWSTDQMRHGTYNLYYCTADRITGPYGPRKFAGRCLGHGTIFQYHVGHWWCTAFLNGTYVPPGDPSLSDPDIDTAVSINPQGLTIVPLDIRHENGDVVVKALDPNYANPGPEEVQKF